MYEYLNEKEKKPQLIEQERVYNFLDYWIQKIVIALNPNTSKMKYYLYLYLMQILTYLIQFWKAKQKVCANNKNFQECSYQKKQKGKYNLCPIEFSDYFNGSHLLEREMQEH